MSSTSCGRLVASLFILLIASSALPAYAQKQSATLSAEDEAEIIQSLLELELNSLDSEIGTIRTFSSANISPISARQITRLGFSLITANDIERARRDHVINYVILKSIVLRDGLVVVKLSAVSEGRPCFAPAFSRERSFTYAFHNSENGWVGRILKRSVTFPFSRSLATTP